jgi:hypothetical protein
MYPCSLVGSSPCQLANRRGQAGGEVGVCFPSPNQVVGHSSAILHMMSEQVGAKRAMVQLGSSNRQGLAGQRDGYWSIRPSSCLVRLTDGGRICNNKTAGRHIRDVSPVKQQAPSSLCISTALHDSCTLGPLRFWSSALPHDLRNPQLPFAVNGLLHLEAGNPQGSSALSHIPSLAARSKAPLCLMELL